MSLHRNVYLWYSVTFFSYAAFTLPIWVIFNTKVLGLSNTEAYVLGMVPYGLSALFEIPTGSWADKYGRARVYQIGTVFYILSVASYIFLNHFYALLAFQVLGSLGLAMQSGGLEALVHDTLDGAGVDKYHLYSQVHGRKMAILFISRVLTVLVSGFLYTINPRLPFVVASITYVIGLVASLFFKEIRAEAPTTLSNLKHIKETIGLVIEKKTLVLFLALVTLYTIASETLFAVYQPYFQSLHIKVGQFGIFYAVISALSALGALTITALLRRFGPFGLLLTMMLGVLFTLGLMLLRVPSLVYLALLPSSIAFGFIITLQNVTMQKFISSRHQATAVSVASFLRSTSFFISVVILGIALDHISVHTVNAILAIMAGLFTLVFIVNFMRKAEA